MSGQTALRVLRRRWMVVLGAIVVVAGLTVARGLSEPKLYVSSASLLFRDPGFDEKLFGTTFFAPSDDPEREAQTNIELVSLDVVAERTAAALGGDYEPEDVTDKIAIAGGGGSNVITVDASDTVAAESARIANTFAREYIEFRRDADRSKIQDAQALFGASCPRCRPMGWGQRREHSEIGSTSSTSSHRCRPATPSWSRRRAQPRRPVRRGWWVRLFAACSWACSSPASWCC